MDSFRLVCFVLSFGLNIVSYVQCLDDEPVCTSRYDFESKLLRDSIKMDFEMSLLKEQYRKDIESLQATTKTALDRLEALSDKLQNEQSSKLNSFEKLGSDMKQTIDEKVATFEKTQEAQGETLEDLYKFLEAKVDDKLKEIEEHAVKAPVNFLAKDVTDTSPGKNTVFKFPEILMNVGNAYDPSTGVFSVPVNGTYAFTVQFCIKYQRHIHVEMHADEKMINNAVLADHDGSFPCQTLTTYVYLHQDTRVYVKNGSSSSSGTIIYVAEKSRWPMFMGTLVQ